MDILDIQHNTPLEISIEDDTIIITSAEKAVTSGTLSPKTAMKDNIYMEILKTLTGHNKNTD